uniref:Reverse transcriptase zinc-binding domain-containing protein n=1 Tax=Arundo donax TaxID=35708 RepID=A0A0A9DF12_ARUDO
MGSTNFGPWKRVWKTWAPLRCKFFIWLAINNRCWTADRLAKRGLQHPAACPLCDQAEEIIQHLLVECVFARQVWMEILQQLNLGTIAPQPSSTIFPDGGAEQQEVPEKNPTKVSTPSSSW